MGPESWRPVVGYEGAYEVSDRGHVRSLPGGQRKGIVLKPVPAGRGYLTVQLCVEGIIRRFYIHHLVALAFIGARPAGLDVCHGNGDFLDNRPANLRYATVSANNRDAIRHGHNAESRKTHCAQGHEYAPENTTIRESRSADGGIKRKRECRLCRRVWVQRANRRKRERMASLAA